MSHSPYKEYVVNDAVIKCTFCMVESKIKAKNNNVKTAQGKYLCIEKDKDDSIGPFGYCGVPQRRCNPQLKNWVNPRSVMSIDGSKALVEDAKIECSVGGEVSFKNSGQVSKVTIPGPGYISLGVTSRALGFINDHPNKARRIGKFKSGSHNITTVASLYAYGLGLDEVVGGIPDAFEGSQVNAFRHVMWQAIITDEFGADIAHRVGNSHEENPLADQQFDAMSSSNILYSGLLTLSEVDEIIDLKNNKIAREIAVNNPNSSNEKLALLLLDHFYNEGFYTAKESSVNRYYTIQLEKISTEKYNNAKKELEPGGEIYEMHNRKNDRGEMWESIKGAFDK